MRLPVRALQPVALQVPPDDEWHSSRLLDFTEGRELVVGVPTRDGQELTVDVGTELRMEVILPDGVRRFSTHVRRATGSPTSLHLDWPQEATRIQRRDHVRVDVQVPFTSTIPPRGDVPTRQVTGTTIDVSAGGVRLNLPEALPDETVIEVKLTLPTVGVLECEGRVLRTGEWKEERGVQHYWNAVEFADMSETARREIIRFVFNVQREQLRRT